ncbi:MAG: replicative DNA helicase [Gammaproteobacteria bacterium]
MADTGFAPRQKRTKLNEIKVPPHSIEAEQAVLGGVMLDNEVWGKVEEQLTEHDFYRYDHQVLFRTLAELARQDKPFDVLTVTDALKLHGNLDKAGGEVYLFELARNTPSVANINAYIGIVYERAVLRRLIHAATNIADSAYDPEGREAKELLDDAERSILAVGGERVRGSGPQDIQQLVATAVDKVHFLYDSGSDLTGVSTGFEDLDNLTSGLQPSDLIIVAGRPSMGKTMFATNMAERVAFESKKPVLIFSMEMPGDAIALRLLSSLGRIDQHKIRTGKLSDEDWVNVSSAVGVLSNMPIFVDDTPALTPVELRSRARRLAKERGHLSLIVIDYLQLMRVPGLRDNRVAEISEISRSLKALAKELNVPVIALSQLNRSLEQRQDRRPVMSDLRESGAIEQDADLIAFIYRDEVYNENSPDKGTAEIIVAKHRNGPIGKIRLTFRGQYTRFDNYIANQFGISSEA